MVGDLEAPENGWAPAFELECASVGRLNTRARLRANHNSFKGRSSVALRAHLQMLFTTYFHRLHHKRSIGVYQVGGLTPLTLSLLFLPWIRGTDLLGGNGM